MSRIDDLIDVLCPNGVPRAPLGMLGTISRGMRFVKADIVEVGAPCIHYGELYTRYRTWTTEAFSHLTLEHAARLRAASPGDVIIASAGETVEDIGKAVAWLGTTDVVIHDACYAFRSDLDPRYVAYFLQTDDFHRQIRPFISSSKISSISPEKLGKALIPVPPIEVQCEIVRILDSFDNLERELEGELEARRRQYAYYRRWLLTSDVHPSARWMTIGELGSVAMCRRIFRSETSPVGDIPFYKIGTFGGRADAFISRELFNDYRYRYPFPKKGDVLISAAGTIGRAVPYDGEPAYFQDSNIVWIDNDESLVINRFLFHWCRIVQWSTDESTIRRLYNDNLKRARIQVPSLHAQKRIVGTLDDFDALVSDLSVGLPAELAARRKQFAYYRDRLLTFREAA